MSSGNGSDNAHNNQFGGGGRGPTGGVNMGSGSPGNAGRGNGYYTLSPPTGKPAAEFVNGEWRIRIDQGMNWVSDISIHWSDGHSGSDSRDNLRTNVTAKVPSGYRAAISGYIYMVTVDGNDNIMNVSLYSRPISTSRKDWKNGETTRQTQARALVQTQLNSKKAAAAAIAKKAADEAAAAEAKRKAAEEAKRKQAEWDAAHPLEAAQRDVNDASALATVARNKIIDDNAQIKSNNKAINSRQARLNTLNTEIQRYAEMVRILQGVDSQQEQQILGAQILPRQKERDRLQGEIKGFNVKNSALQNNISAQKNLVNKANRDLSAAQDRLNKAQADAAEKRQAEAARQAEETARVKAAQDAAAKVEAEEESKAKAEAEAATKAAALEAARSKLEEPNVFSIKALAAFMNVASSPMAFAETGLGGITLSTEAAGAAWTLVRGVVTELLELTVAGSGIGALIAAIGYIPSAGEGSDNVPGRNNINMFSTFLDPSVIGLPDDNVIKAALKSNGKVSSKIRGRVFYDNNQFNTELIRTDIPTDIRVVKAIRDSITGLYGYTVPATDTLPSRTILVSPDSVPGAGGLPPLVTPVVHEIGATNTGNENVPDTDLKVETYPLNDEPDFEDYIIVFEDLNLKPIYVMLQDSLDDGKFTRKQLDRKYKHASDFGINDTRKNRETLSNFRDKIEEHLEDPATYEKGTYILVDGSKVFFNDKTLIVVVLDKDGIFVSGWALDPSKPTMQYENYINTGVLR